MSKYFRTDGFRGGRGLKWGLCEAVIPEPGRPPAREAWIEMQENRPCALLAAIVLFEAV